MSGLIGVYRVQDSGFRDFRIQGSGFRVGRHFHGDLLG